MSHSVTYPYLALLFIGLGIMLHQLLVKQKRLEHIFFAIFCGSMAMVAAQQLSAETLGVYRFLFGIVTCATCNALWLTSRAIFSGEDAINKRHIIFALIIAALIIIHNSMQMVYELSAIEHNTHRQIGSALGEVINLFSSTVLALTCWEALNGILKKDKQEFWLRTLFVASFCVGFSLCTMVPEVFFAPDVRSNASQWLMVIAAVQVMLVTQVIMWFKQHESVDCKAESNLNINRTDDKALDVDQGLILGINLQVIENKRYLSPNLKMIDLANELNVSEYKVSRAIRHHFAAPNFNYFINSLRIEHARNLLEQADSKSWPIIVIAMESGFSSLATFNRVFKTRLGHTPNEHRKGAQVS